MWKEVHDNTLQFKERTIILQHKRDNDVFLNEKFAEHGYSVNQQKILNIAERYSTGDRSGLS